MMEQLYQRMPEFINKRIMSGMNYKQAQIEWNEQKKNLTRSIGGYRHKGNTKKQKRPNKKRSNKKY